MIFFIVAVHLTMIVSDFFFFSFRNTFPFPALTPRPLRCAVLLQEVLRRRHWIPYFVSCEGGHVYFPLALVSVSAAPAVVT